jgi:hypothetical protein
MREGGLKLSDRSQSSPPPEGPLPGSQQQCLERGELGMGPGQDRGQYQEEPGREFHGDQCRWEGRQPDQGNRFRWSAALDNEECWLYQTFLRSLGIVYIEHQARI